MNGDPLVGTVVTVLVIEIVQFPFDFNASGEMEPFFSLNPVTCAGDWMGTS